MNLCSGCGIEFEGNFCPGCGLRYGTVRKCRLCGAYVSGKYCSVCGARYTDTDSLSENPSSAETFPPVKGNVTRDMWSEGLKFKKVYDGYSVTGKGKFSGPDLVVPAEYGGKPVVSIGDSAFAGCAFLKTVIVPDTVKNVGFYAFAGCTTLTYAHLPREAVLEGFTFSGCTSLRWVNVPNMAFFANSIFSGCASLTSAGIHDFTPTIADGAFRGCASLKSVTLPSYLEKIGSEAFAGCTSLEFVTYPEFVPQSDADAERFRNSDVVIITSILPEYPVPIGERAFCGCVSLKDIVLPRTVRIIMYDAFTGCPSLESVYYRGSRKDWKKVYLFDGADTFPPCTTIYYYSEKKPSVEGNFWHYVDGEPAVWRDE